VSATIERISKIAVAVSTEADRVLLSMDGLKEDVRIITDLPRAVAEKLTLDLIAGGFGPTQRGGRA
jgi:hypothetical protein